jgi:hypothetical protein
MALRAPISAIALCFSIAAASGCAQEQEAIVIVRTPQWIAEDNMGVVEVTCAVDPEADASFLRGTLDVSYPTAYWLPLEVRNNLLSTMGAQTVSGIDNSEMRLLFAEISLEMTQGSEIMEGLDESLTDFSWSLATDSFVGGTSLGILVETVPYATAAALREGFQNSQYAEGTRLELLATVRVTAERAPSGGKRNEVESRPYSFPIDLCLGCLATCAGCTSEGKCPDGTEPGLLAGGVCGNAQDVSTQFVCD